MSGMKDPFLEIVFIFHNLKYLGAIFLINNNPEERLYNGTNSCEIFRYKASGANKKLLTLQIMFLKNSLLYVFIIICIQLFKIKSQ